MAAGCPDVAYFTPLVEMTPPSLRYFYDRELAEYTITRQNQKNLDTDTTPPRRRQSQVADQIFRRPPYRVRPAPLWVGIVNTTTMPVIERIWAEQSAKSPATRFLLASELPMHTSGRTRVQIVAQHTIARHDLPPAERAQAAMAWLEDYATEHGYSGTDASAVGDVPLRRFV